jgi:hypothetical protein
MPPISPPSLPSASPLAFLSALPPPVLVAFTPAMATHHPHSFSPTAMPLSCSQTVPYFSRHIDDSLDNFLKEYEELAKDCRLTEQQKCEMVLCYVALTHCDLWKSLDEFHLSDWMRFHQALSCNYVSPSRQGQYSKQKLLEFVKSSSRSHMTEEEDILWYFRCFILLSKPLLNSQQLTKEEQNTAFWYGFHPDNHREMSSHLFGQHPKQPKGHTFNYEDIFDVA